MKEITVYLRDAIKLPGNIKRDEHGNAVLGEDGQPERHPTQELRTLSINGNFRHEIKATPMGPFMLAVLMQVDGRDTEVCIPWHQIGYFELRHAAIELAKPN